MRPALAARVLAVPLLLALGAEGLGRADESIIKRPGDHPRYIFEIEPHLLFGWGDPFFPLGVPGAGFRGTFHVADGFVRNINDSIGIGFGLDVATNGHVVVPVVMQWNFWLSTHWSIFGEPGIAIGGGGPNAQLEPAFFAGARLHFTPRIALALRLGYPALSIGVTFLL